MERPYGKRSEHCHGNLKQKSHELWQKLTEASAFKLTVWLFLWIKQLCKFIMSKISNVIYVVTLLYNDSMLFQ